MDNQIGGTIDGLSLNVLVTETERLPALQQNAALACDFEWLVPKPIVIVVKINGFACCALLDSGSLDDFVACSLADQLNLKHIVLAKPISCTRF